MAELNELIFEEDSTTFNVLESLDVTSVGVQVANLERLVADQATTIHFLSTELSLTNARVGGLQTTTTQMQVEINLNSAAVASFETRLRQVEDAVGNETAIIDGILTDISQLQNDVRVSLSRINDINARIDGVDSNIVSLENFMRSVRLGWVDPSERLHIFFFQTRPFNDTPSIPSRERQALVWDGSHSVNYIELNAIPGSGNMYTGAPYGVTWTINSGTGPQSIQTTIRVHSVPGLGVTGERTRIEYNKLYFFESGQPESRQPPLRPFVFGKRTANARAHELLTSDPYIN